LTAVIAVESRKLFAQLTTRILLAVCAVAPVILAFTVRIQSSVPADTLFGRSIKESGFALPLVVLGFAMLWVFPVLASVVGGDLFAAEDRYGTWKSVVTRSRSREELFAGKVLVAIGCSAAAVALLALSSVAAGLLIIGAQPLIDLSGVPRSDLPALTRIGLAWAAMLPPTFAMTALAVLLSVATRSTAAGIGLPVLAALVMQLYALVDGPEAVRRVLITSAFSAWHGLLTEPRYYGPLFDGMLVSAVYMVVCLAAAELMFRRRDFGG